MLLRALRITRNVVLSALHAEGPRSPHWATIRKQYINIHPRCEACGANYLLNVHHILPFHLHPERELDLTNLITLCVATCHLQIGHGDDFRAYNPDIRKDAATILASPDPKAMVETLAPIVKAKRLYS